MTELHCHMVTEKEQEEVEVTVLRKSWDHTDMMMPMACSVGPCCTDSSSVLRASASDSLPGLGAKCRATLL